MSLFRITTAEGLAWARTAAPDVSMEEHVARERAAMRLRQSPVRPFAAVAAEAPRAARPAAAVGPWPSWDETVLEAERTAAGRVSGPPVAGAAAGRVPSPPAAGATASPAGALPEALPSRETRRRPEGPGRRPPRGGAERPSASRGHARRGRGRTRRAADDGRQGLRRLWPAVVLVAGLALVWQLGASGIGARAPVAADLRAGAAPHGAVPAEAGGAVAARPAAGTGLDASVAGGMAAAGVDAAALGLPLPPGAVLLPETAQRVERPGLGHWLALTAHSTEPWTRLVEFYRAQAVQAGTDPAALEAVASAAGAEPGAAGRGPAATAAAAARAGVPGTAAGVQESSPGAGQWQLTFHDGSDGARRAVLLLQDGETVRISLSRWVPALAVSASALAVAEAPPAARPMPAAPVSAVR